MNLKQMDPKLFCETIDRLAEDAKIRFNRDVNDRVEEMRRGLGDLGKWNLPGEMAGLFTQWFARDSIVFTTTIPDPSPGMFRHQNEGTVRLEVGGYSFELGRCDLNALYNRRVMLFAVLDTEKKP